MPRTATDYLVVASKGGDPKAPGWYFNLKKQPEIEINVGTNASSRDGADRRCPTTPTIRGCGRSSTRTTHNVYRGYQTRTDAADPG